MSKKKEYGNILTAMGFDIPVKTFQVKGTDRTVDYLSANAIAKFRATEKYPADRVIQVYLTKEEALDFIERWMIDHDWSFNPKHLLGIKQKRAARERIQLTPSKLVEAGVTCIRVERGKYGGVWFHHDLALEFARWVDPDLAYYINLDYQKLKMEFLEARPVPDELWKELRQKTKLMHTTMMDAIRSQMLSCTLEFIKAHVAEITEKVVREVTMLDTDTINELVFKKTAKEWREENPGKKGNMRDYATKDELELIYLLERQNTMYARRNVDRMMRKACLGSDVERYRVWQKERKERDPLYRLQVGFRKRVESGEYYQKGNTWYDKETGHPVLLVPKEW